MKEIKFIRANITNSVCSFDVFLKIKPKSVKCKQMVLTGAGLNALGLIYYASFDDSLSPLALLAFENRAASGAITDISINVQPNYDLEISNFSNGTHSVKICGSAGTVTTNASFNAGSILMVLEFSD